MNYLTILRGSNEKIREEEFKSIFKTYNYVLINFKNIINTLYKFRSNKIDKNKFERTSYCNYIFEVLKEFKYNNFFIELKNFKYQFEGSFFIKIKKFTKNKINYTENDLAEIMWDKSKDKKVKINGKNIFYFIFLKDKIYLTKLFFKNSKDFLKRMPKKRPFNNPYTLKSDLAKACLNFLCLKEGKIILDSFCGYGGILLEAESLGLKNIGIDISWKDLIGCKKNFQYFFNKNPNLIVSDTNYKIFKNNSIDGIATDIPYGKSTKVVGNKLYVNFLKNSYEVLKPNSKIVIIYSNYFDIKELFSNYFKIENILEEYINKSMTRYIIIGRKV